MTFLSRMSLVLRRWPVIVACLLLGIAAGVGATKVMKPLHTSQAKVFVVVAGKQAAPDMSSASQYAESQMTSYETVAAAPLVLDPVISQLHLGMTSQQLGQEVLANAATGSFVLSISVSDASAQRASDIANAIASQMGVAIKELTPMDKSGSKPLDSKTISPAVPDTTSASSHLIRNAAGGGILGLLIGIALAFLWAAMDLQRSSEPSPSGPRRTRVSSGQGDGSDD